MVSSPIIGYFLGIFDKGVLGSGFTELPAIRVMIIANDNY
jgi:hypothetical protein